MQPKINKYIKKGKNIQKKYKWPINHKKKESKHTLFVSVKVLQRNRANRIYVFIICKVGQQAGNSDRISVLLPRGRIPSLGNLEFKALRPLIDWLRPTHVIESNLYSKSVDLLMLITSTKYLHLDWAPVT